MFILVGIVIIVMLVGVLVIGEVANRRHATHRQFEQALEVWFGLWLAIITLVVFLVLAAAIY
jgi:hypothetical protein